VTNRYRSVITKPWVLLPILAVILASCRRPTGPIAQEQANLSWLGSMYAMYISQNQGHAPKSVDELRKYVEKTTNSERLARLKLASTNDLFVSPRDGKPFTMVSYEKLPPLAAGAPPPIVMYETQGQNGEHAIAFLGGGTKTIDEAELQKLLPPQSKKAR
jgi:hypothetical protein